MKLFKKIINYFSKPKDDTQETINELKDLFTQLFNKYIENAEKNNLFSTLLKDQYVYIADMDTHEVIWMNDNLKSLVGENAANVPCYKLFQNLDHPCPFCNNNIIKQKPNQPYNWIHYNEKIGRIYYITDYYVPKINGQLRNLRVEEAKDITPLLGEICKLKRKLNNDRKRNS